MQPKAQRGTICYFKLQCCVFAAAIMAGNTALYEATALLGMILIGLRVP